MWHKCCCLIVQMASYHICSNEVFSVLSHGTSRIVQNHHISSMLLEVLCHECLRNHPSDQVAQGQAQGTKTSQVTAPCPLSVVLSQWYLMCMAKTHTTLYFICNQYITTLFFTVTNHWWLYCCQAMIKIDPNSSSS